MILYPSQLAVLQALQSAENYRTQDCGKVFDNFAANFLNHPKFENQVKWLIDNSLIDEKGNITPKGRTFSSVNPAYLSPKELGIRTNQFIFKALSTFTDKKEDITVFEKCLQFMSEDTFLDLATFVNKEMEARFPEQIEEYNQRKEVANFQELTVALEEQAKVEDHILMVQAPVEVVVNGELLTEEEYVAQEVKVKKSRKKVEA